MGRHLLIVANGFRAVGLLLAVPSLLVCLWITWILIQIALMKTGKPAADSEALNMTAADISKYGLIGLLMLGAKAAVKSMELVSGLALWALRAIDVVAAILTLIGASSFLTGRGLILHAAWARIAAGLIASFFLLASFLALTSMRRGANLIALAPIAVSLYMLWVLTRRFN